MKFFTHGYNWLDMRVYCLNLEEVGRSSPVSQMNWKLLLSTLLWGSWCSFYWNMQHPWWKNMVHHCWCSVGKAFNIKWHFSVFVRTVAVPAILLYLYSIILPAIVITYDCERTFGDDNSVVWKWSWMCKNQFEWTYDICVMLFTTGGTLYLLEELVQQMQPLIHSITSSLAAHSSDEDTIPLIRNVLFQVMYEQDDCVVEALLASCRIHHCLTFHRQANL